MRKERTQIITQKLFSKMVLNYYGNGMSDKKSVWLTYAWEDNKEQDVDFIAQELIRAGVDVKLDRWNLTAGRRLWEQIESFIQDPEKSDGWILYATQASLGSEACKEEFAYALDRALNTRGEEFPVIGLFPSPVDKNLIPACIKTRLYVSITDPDWKERIISAIEGRTPDITKALIKPYVITVHKLNRSDEIKLAIEVRPRAGTWSPFLAAVPIDEKNRTLPNTLPKLYHGPANRTDFGVGILFGVREGVSSNGKLWMISADNEATPTQSYYIICKELPSFLLFGVNRGQPQYKVTLK